MPQDRFTEDNIIEPRTKVDANFEAERFLVRQDIVSKRREEWRGRGKAFERHLFGGIEKNEVFKKQEREILGSASGFGKRLSHRQEEALFDLIKKYQPFNPVRPNIDYARNLREAIAEELKLQDEHESKRLKFYTAVVLQGEETAVDVKLGTDAFFEYEEDGKIYKIKMDATTNPDNPAKDVINADILIGPEHVPDQEKEPEEYRKEIKQMAQKIAQKLLKKIEQDEYRTLRHIPREDSLVTASRSKKVQEYIPPKKKGRR